MADWHTLYNALSYTFGNCTQFVAGTFSWVGKAWGNGCQWADSAKKQGLSVSSTPVVGSIAVYDCGLPGSQGDGHVAAVTAVDSTGFTLNEVNWDAFNQVDTRHESLSSGTGSHIIGFILPPGTTDTGGGTGAQELSANLNPFDPSGLVKTIASFGQTVEADLFRVALSLLGFYVAMVGIGLLLASTLRKKIEGNDIPTIHSQTASTAMKTSDEVLEHV